MDTIQATVKTYILEQFLRDADVNEDHLGSLEQIAALVRTKQG